MVENPFSTPFSFGWEEEPSKLWREGLNSATQLAIISSDLEPPPWWVLTAKGRQGCVVFLKHAGWGSSVNVLVLVS